MINSTADFNLDYTDDVLYLGYVQANGGTWNQGGVLRLQTNGSVDPNDWRGQHGDRRHRTGHLLRGPVAEQHHPDELALLRDRPVLLLPAERPGRPQRRRATTTRTATRRLFGVKEPCFAGGTMTPSCTDDGHRRLAHRPHHGELRRHHRPGLVHQPGQRYEPHRLRQHGGAELPRGTRHHGPPVDDLGSRLLHHAPPVQRMPAPSGVAPSSGPSSTTPGACRSMRCRGKP